MRAVKGVRVSYHHPVHVMDVRKCGDAYQIRHKEYQQAQSTYNFILLLHVRNTMFFRTAKIVNYFLFSPNKSSKSRLEAGTVHASGTNFH